MDRQTLEAYARAPAAYAAEWEDEQEPPEDLYALLRAHFSPGPTADVGCGSGRDAAWLHEHGFPASGYDASPSLIAQARRRHPGIAFAHAALPALAGVPEASFANVLCETVIMHLPRNQIAPAVRRLRAILASGGTLHLSWRVTEGADVRDVAGRLYSAFDASLAIDALDGAALLHDSEDRSASSGRLVHRLIARAPS